MIESFEISTSVPDRVRSDDSQIITPASSGIVEKLHAGFEKALC
jgi:hypothetical protein